MSFSPYFIAKSPANNIDQFPQLIEEAPLFIPITTSYQVSGTLSNPSLTSSTASISASTSISITATEITSATNPPITTYVALWNQNHTELVQGNVKAEVNFIWACAQAVNYTTITFSLTQTGTHTIPTWVQLDTVNQKMLLNKTPKLSVTQTFYFSLKIAYASEVHYKRFEITVEECNIPNCEVCQLGDSSLCGSCQGGYQTSKDQNTCSQIPPLNSTNQTDQSNQTNEVPPSDAGSSSVGSLILDKSNEIATALVVTSMVMASASSFLSLSSPNSLFCILNNLQLSILLPMVPDYFSPKVLDFLDQMGFSLLSFDFIKFKDIPFVEDITEWVSYPQPDEYLNSLGMRSGSSVVNYLSLMAIVILIGVVHMLIFWCNSCAEKSKNKKLRKFFKKLFIFFTFNIYIRIFMEAFLFTSLSIFAEIYTLNLDTAVTKVSFGFCILFAMGTSVLFLLSFYVYFKSFPEIDKKYWPCTEYFDGIKAATYSKLYSSLFMLLRLLLSSLLVFGESVAASYKSTYFYLLNIVFGVYLVIVRPFQSSQDNIIEVVNQSLFCCLAVSLSWLNTETDWTPFYEDFYISIFMASSAIGCLVCFIFLIKSAVVFIMKRTASKSQQSITLKKTPPTRKRPQVQGGHGRGLSFRLRDQPSSLSRSSMSMVPRPNQLRKIQRPHNIELRRKF